MTLQRPTIQTLLRRFFLIILVPFLAAGLAAVWFGNKQLRTEREGLLSSEAQTAALRFNDLIDHSKSFSALLSLLDPMDQPCSEVIDTVRRPFAEAYAVVAVAGADGRIVCGHPTDAVGIDISDRPWFNEARDSGTFVMGGYQVSRTMGGDVLVVARPVTRGERIYYVGAAISLQFLSRYIAGGERAAFGDIVIVDGTGRVVASTVEELPLGAEVTIPATAGLTRATLGGSQRDVFHEVGEIGGQQFDLLAIAPANGMFTVPERMGLSLILFAVLLGLSAALFGYRRLRQDVIAPIQDLRDAAPRVAAREAAQVRQTPGAPTELREAVSAFNEMSRKLRDTSVELERASSMAALGTWKLKPGADSITLSDTIQAIMGFENHQVPIADVEARIVAGDLPAFRESLRRVMEDHEIVELEFRAHAKEREIRIFRAQTGPIEVNALETEPVEITGIVQDVTDLRSREAALVRSQSLLRLAGQAARLGGWRYDTQSSEFVEYSESGSTRTVSVDDALDTLIGEDRTRIERAFWACVAGGIAFDEIVKQRTQRGEERWIRVIGEAERAEEGRIISVHGALQDVDEMVRARETSAEMEALLTNILDSLGDGFLVTDLEGRVRYFNWRAQVMLNLTEKRSLIGHVVSEEVEPELADALRELADKARSEDASQTREVRVRANETWLELNVHTSPRGVALHVRDMTQERDRQARLRLLDAAVRRLNDMVVITNAKQIDAPREPEIVFVNDAFLNMTGFSRDEAIGATPRILQGEETEREELDEIRQALEANRPIRTELTNYRKDGSKITLEIDIAPIFDAEGECTHFVAVQRDTTERRTAEEQLREREEQFRLVSWASNDVIWDWNLDTGLIWHSDDYEHVFGRPPAEPHTIDADLERIHPDDRLGFSRSLDEALNGNENSWSHEYRIEAADGTYRQMIDRGFIVRHENGTPRRMVGAVSDVTEMRSLDAQLHQAQKLESVGQLTGGVAHDFNNLLTIILGNCDLLLEELEQETLKPKLISISDAAERGSRLASSLLAFSRRQQLQPRPVYIDRLIRSSEDLLRRAVPESIDFECELGSTDAMVRVDPDKLQSAVLNLVINAVGAIEGHGKILVRTGWKELSETEAAAPGCRTGGFVLIEVIDDGPGMPAEVAERAFEPFFTTKEVGGGTGLGLSSVYGLVRQSGGVVDLDTAPGEGTRVSLCLPPYEGELDDEEAAETEKASSAPVNGGRILLVEDDEDVRAFASRCLSNLGYEVREAETGAAALEILSGGDRFDLLLTDVVMPGGMTGVELAREARRRQPDLAVVMMSGYSEDLLTSEVDVEATASPLFKPFRAAELAKKVEEALGQT
ncbi:PAS domain-containing protein [Psychromarinibacter sp. C21-152]|uniref:histidine kinase n=1 Tax=Psychromarinibacter sediminicola TaxID=3033385 RepID=A0AAE3TCA6_9RHOB|nr:PAS domain-containing protein [Psychromarinibacter sediminicola]MDF0603759.1 PAS domain-containing protein [Psychromarinibacter sediminicola]